MRRFFYNIVLLLVPCSFCSSVTADEEQVSFYREILPILRANCIACHKPSKSKGGLDLTTHGSLLQGGNDGLAINAGNALGSRLREVISGEEPEMPKERNDRRILQ